MRIDELPSCFGDASTPGMLTLAWRPALDEGGAEAPYFQHSPSQQSIGETLAPSQPLQRQTSRRWIAKSVPAQSLGNLLNTSERVSSAPRVLVQTLHHG